MPSPHRPNTPAARYQDQVDEETKKSRLHRLFDLTERVSHELNEQLLGRVVPVLIDDDSRRNPSHWQGRGEDNRVVNFPKTGREVVGDIVDVRILRAGSHSLSGEAATPSLSLPVFGAVDGAA